MSIPLVCVNGVVPPELTFARLARDVTERPVRLHDLVGYREELPPGYGVDTIMLAISRVASSHIAFLRPRSTPNPPSSISLALSPVPNSTRPLDRMSRAEIRSATRAGWL